MARPPSPQFTETPTGDWSWLWREHVGIEGVVEIEVELQWLLGKEEWKVRRRYDRAGWTDALIVHDLADPETFDHADQLAREYAERQ